MSTSSTAITVPLLDLKAQFSAIRDEIEPAIQEVLESQVFIGGPRVAALEERCAEYLGIPNAVGCSNGSDAIILALDALGIGPGDEVIVPTFTFFSTAGSVSRVGATPVFADIDPATYQIDPASIRRRSPGRRGPSRRSSRSTSSARRAISTRSWRSRASTAFA